jgi:hypothetical protein
MLWHKAVGTGPSHVIVLHGWFNLFNLFSGVCDRDETALGLIAESVGCRLSDVWMKRLLKQARDLPACFLRLTTCVMPSS